MNTEPIESAQLTPEESMFFAHGNLALNLLKELDCPVLVIMFQPTTKDAYLCQDKLLKLNPQEKQNLQETLKMYLENFDA
jgi:hypothetical protein